MLRFLLVLALCVQQIVAVDPIVDLGYAKYRGMHQGKDNGTILWAGMRYARSVSRVDGMRFAAPQDPLPERQGSIVEANQFGSICIGSHHKLKNEFGDRQSEDCLFANVFAPAHAKNTSALPVYVFIQGGGFNDNGNANYNGTQLIDAAGGHMVIVNFNYRVGPYGFLASKEIAEDKTLSLNNGLKDQRQLLKWVQDHIDQFGGDPKHVTLGGASAGAGSVVLQLTAFGGRNDNLFHAAIAESPAFPPMRNVTYSQFAYDALLKSTSCADLACLRALDAVSFQAAVGSLKMAFPHGSAPPIYFWNPTLDYDLIRDYTYNEIGAGHLVKVPTMFGDTTNEGWTFTPKSITSQQRAEQFLADQFTSLNHGDEKRIRRVWIGPMNVFFDNKWKNVASDIYGHIRYTCGGLNISSAYATLDSPSATAANQSKTSNTRTPVWQYRWNVGAALHVSELSPIWGHAATAPGVFMQGYIASFIRSYNPNTHGDHFSLPQNVTLKSPAWELFGASGGKRMLFDNGNRVGMEEVAALEWEKCDVITGMGVQLEQATSGAGAWLSTSLSSCAVFAACAVLMVQWWMGI